MFYFVKNCCFCYHQLYLECASLAACPVRRRGRTLVPHIFIELKLRFVINVQLLRSWELLNYHYCIYKY